MKKQYGLRRAATPWTTKEAARSYAARAISTWTIEISGKYYTVCPADANKLVRTAGAKIIF